VAGLAVMKWLQTVSRGRKERQKYGIGYKRESLKKFIKKVRWLEPTVHSIQRPKQMRQSIYFLYINVITSLTP
jgi:hypothetical protein